MLHPKVSIGIIGYGFVGQAVAYGFSTTQIYMYDKYKSGLHTLEETCQKSDFIFICLPTPIKSDESGIDLGIIEENLEQITKYTDHTEKLIIIKSTVVPGTTAKFAQKYPHSNFAFNPEFLTEKNYLQDFVNADRTIIGAFNDKSSQKLTELYMQQFPKTPLFKTDPTSAEMVKYMSNCFLATKVIFANEMYDICDALNIKYEEVKEMVVADHRIYDSHLDVTSDRGFGQKCFPKDLLALRALAKQNKVDTTILDNVWLKNIRIRKIKDWEEIPFAVSPVQVAAI